MPALATFIEQETAREAARRRHHESEQARGRGVAYSGMGVGPYRACSVEQVAAAAQASLAEHEAWRASADGRLVEAFAAIRDAEDMLRAGRNRGLTGPGELERAWDHHRRLLDAANEISKALAEIGRVSQ